MELLDIPNNFTLKFDIMPSKLSYALKKDLRCA